MDNDDDASCARAQGTRKGNRERETRLALVLVCPRATATNTVPSAKRDARRTNGPPSPHASSSTTVSLRPHVPPLLQCRLFFVRLFFATTHLLSAVAARGTTRRPSSALSRRRHRTHLSTLVVVDCVCPRRYVRRRPRRGKQLRERGLTQQQIAQAVGTSQSCVISPSIVASRAKQPVRAQPRIRPAVVTSFGHRRPAAACRRVPRRPFPTAGDCGAAAVAGRFHPRAVGRRASADPRRSAATTTGARVLSSDDHADDDEWAFCGPSSPISQR